MATRKTYEQTARVIRCLALPVATRAQVAKLFACEYEQENGAFDVGRFFEACEVTTAT